MYELECAREDSVLQDLRTISRQQLASEPAAAQHVLTEELRTQYLSRFKGHPAARRVLALGRSRRSAHAAAPPRPRLAPVRADPHARPRHAGASHQRPQDHDSRANNAERRTLRETATLRRRRVRHGPPATRRRLARRVPHRLGVVFCVRPSIHVR
jgi:hypothetical protein